MQEFQLFFSSFLDIELSNAFALHLHAAPQAYLLSVNSKLFDDWTMWLRNYGAKSLNEVPHLK